MTMEITTQLRRCVGSTRFGIEAHEADAADAADFPVQASRKDGLGRMCKPHWRQYTNALRKAVVARKAAEAANAPIPELEPQVVEMVDEVAPEPEPPTPRRTGRPKATAESTHELDAA